MIGLDQPARQLIRVPSTDPAAEGRVPPYAWVVVTVVAVTLTIASGARFLFGVVLKPMSEEFGWNRAQLTGAVMLAMIVLSICQPLVGMLVDRIGAKKILVGGIALLGVSLVPLSFATSLWQIYLLYGLLTSFGLAAASPVLATSIVGRWFTQNRGLAMSVATSGSAFGQLLIVPVATWIMLATSWQTTYRVLAVALLAVALPLSAIFLRDAPPRGGGRRQSSAIRGRPDVAGGGRTPGLLDPGLRVRRLRLDDGLPQHAFSRLRRRHGDVGAARGQHDLRHRRLQHPGQRAARSGGGSRFVAPRCWR